MNETTVRGQLRSLLEWQDAHVGLDDAVTGLAPEMQGVRPEGGPHSIWELVEHIRIAQRDILDFCRAPLYQERRWPEEYWPAVTAPPSTEVWEASLAAVRADRAALQSMAGDRGVDLTGAIPNGTGQTYLRALVLAADHTAYHVGQIVLVRRLLGGWDRGRPQ